MSRTWTYTYNTFGQVLTEDGPRTDVSDVTTYTYYTCTTGSMRPGRDDHQRARAVTTYNAYNAHGRPMQITDPNGLVTTWPTMRASASRPLRRRHAPGGRRAHHARFWPTGLLKKSRTPTAASSCTLMMRASPNPDRRQRGQSHRLHARCDGQSHQREDLRPLELPGAHAPPRLQHAGPALEGIGAADTAAVTTTFGYDNNGNQTSANAPLSRNTTNLYDELNRLKQITDPASGVTLFGYDANDNLTSVTDPRRCHELQYSGFGDLKTQTSPDTGVTSHTYDSGGNLETSTDARGEYRT